MASTSARDMHPALLSGRDLKVNCDLQLNEDRLMASSLYRLVWLWVFTNLREMSRSAASAPSTVS